MKKEKITLPVGKNKALIFEADIGNKEDMDFAKLCEEVAAARPQSIQEFFMRLSDLQRKQVSEAIKKKGRKI